MLEELEPWPSKLRAVGRRVALAAGVAAVVGAFLLAVFQGLLPEPIRMPLARAAEAAGRSTVAWALALLGLGYAIWRVIRGRRHATPSLESVDRPPEASLLDRPRTGNRFEAIVEDRADRVTDPAVEGDGIRQGLADVLVDLETRAGDRTEAEVRSGIETGEWTDDRVVAAFLGGDAAPDYPLRSRVSGWIRPSRAFERRVERTVDAIHERSNAVRPAANVEQVSQDVGDDRTAGAPTEQREAETTDRDTGTMEHPIDGDAEGTRVESRDAHADRGEPVDGERTATEVER